MPRESKNYDLGYRAGYKKGRQDADLIHQRNDSDLGGFALEETDHVLHQGLGYLRIGLGTDGLTWARYKWTKGPLEGFYTFGSGAGLADALAQVAERVHLVEEGKLKATRDTPQRKYPPKG